MLIRHIEYLVSRKDCVIIPGFGSILAHSQAAKIDSESGIACPPKRIFSFNRDLKDSVDGELANSLARSLGISHSAADNLVRDKVSDICRQLHAQGEFLMGRIGNFIVEPESHSIEFFPTETDQLSVNYSWLPVVKKEQIAVSAPAEEITVHVIKPRPFARFARIAASIAILLAICFIASTPIVIDDAAFASLSPELRSGSAQSLLPSTTAETIYGYTARPDYLKIDVEEANERIADWAFHNAEYLVIVGSFGSAAEAQKYIDYIGNTNLGICEKDGKFRVYAACCDTEVQAYDFIRNSKFGVNGAWVYKKQ